MKTNTDEIHGKLTNTIEEIKKIKESIQYNSDRIININKYINTVNPGVRLDELEEENTVCNKKIETLNDKFQNFEKQLNNNHSEPILFSKNENFKNKYIEEAYKMFGATYKP